MGFGKYNCVTISHDTADPCRASSVLAASISDAQKKYLSSTDAKGFVTFAKPWSQNSSTLKSITVRVCDEHVKKQHALKPPGDKGKWVNFYLFRCEYNAKRFFLKPYLYTCLFLDTHIRFGDLRKMACLKNLWGSDGAKVEYAARAGRGA
jgi:hypothetical protein